VGIHDGHREKTRQRFLKGGLESFAEHEALELLLYYAIPRRDTNPIAHALINRYGSLTAVLSAPIEDLEKVEGIGESAAILLKLVPQLCKKARLADAEQETVLNTVSKVGKYLMEQFSTETNEVLFQLCLDKKGKLLACKRLSEGGVSDAVLDIRRMVENALLTHASGVVLAHNHPSGLALPSVDDIQTTRRLAMALKSVDIELVDHLVVADGDYVSMAQSGYYRQEDNLLSI
jgi:DNA repair protein RadC